MSEAAIRVEDTLAAYCYELPDGLIAREPAGRGCSRLLALDRATGACAHRAFADLPDLLPPGALLVANNSRVVPARLIGRRNTGGRLECLLLTPLPLLRPRREADGFRAEAEGLIKPARAVRPGFCCSFADRLAITVLKKESFGRCRLLLGWSGDLLEALETCGYPPLPPYMRRAADARDAQRYQTVYARRDKSGSIAAPTAGLHFTARMREDLSARGFAWEELTLHVGYGTSSPVREQDIRRHVMHGEYAEIPPETALAVSRARREGRPVIAVGTTTARVLEGVAALHGGEVVPHAGWISLFIRPGFTFQVISGLVTNFHLPGSTLLMLVSALAGRERMLEAYARAVAEGYAFFSYGDAMLIV